MPIDPGYVDSLPIQPLNTLPVQWWQQGVPGYLVNHPFTVGVAATAVGHVTGKSWIRTTGIALLVWSGIDLITRKSQASGPMLLQGADGRQLPKPAWWDLPTTTAQQRLDYLAPPR